MTEAKAIMAIIAGCVMIVIGFINKQFYAAKGLYGAGLGHPIARWKGRLLFLVVGIMFLCAGVGFYFRSR
jgi:hypothetical protein